MFRVFKAPKFQKKANKLLDKEELDELNNFITKLKEGKISGKSLTYNFFREKRIAGKRIYFLVYEEIGTILLISSSNKKYQQETIDEIKVLLPEFKRYAYELHFQTKKK